MRADIAQSACARACRVGPPIGLFLAGLFKGSDSQSCGYSACTSRDFPEFAIRHHLAALGAPSGSPCSLGQYERSTGPRRISRTLRFGQRLRQRLVADHMDAALQNSLAAAQHVVWRHDRDASIPSLRRASFCVHLSE